MKLQSQKLHKHILILSIAILWNGCSNDTKIECQYKVGNKVLFSSAALVGEIIQVGDKCEQYKVHMHKLEPLLKNETTEFSSWIDADEILHQVF
jgi:hypothetical protein